MAEGPNVRNVRRLIAAGQVTAGAEALMLAHALRQDIAAGQRERSVAASRGSGSATGAGVDEFDLLFPPKSAAESAARFAAAERRSAAVAAMSDDEVFAAMGFDQEEPDMTSHAVFTGLHTHDHSDYGGGTHQHPHSHDGEASHGHHGG